MFEGKLCVDAGYSGPNAAETVIFIHDNSSLSPYISGGDVYVKGDEAEIRKIFKALALEDKFDKCEISYTITSKSR